VSLSGEQAGRGMVWCSALCGGVCLWVVLSSLRGDCALLKVVFLCDVAVSQLCFAGGGTPAVAL